MRRICGAEKQATVGLSETEVGLAKGQALCNFLLGESDDLDAAHEDLALEFDVIQGPDGKGRYDKDKSGNVARIKAAVVKAALIKARKEISNL